jgi:dTDP-4-dehydrorhamnose reductase
MKSAWITGANGLIGNYLVQTALKFAPHWCVRALTREQFDLLDFETIRHEFQKDKPQLIIHCGAISAISKAQKVLSAPLTGLAEWLAAHPDEIF